MDILLARDQPSCTTLTDFFNCLIHLSWKRSRNVFGNHSCKLHLCTNTIVTGIRGLLLYESCVTSYSLISVCFAVDEMLRGFGQSCFLFLLL